MSLAAILVLGFFLGMRHATDADHVVAVSTIVSRERTLRAAAPIGVLWGIGHTLTILLVGGAIILFGIVISPRLGLGMELTAAMMLVLLGVTNLATTLRDATVLARTIGPEAAHGHAHSHVEPKHAGTRRSLRPLAVGVVHGVAGSAAVALLVLGTISDPAWGLAYLLVFGIGTIAGMLVITTALAVPMVAAARRFEHFRRTLGTLTGLASIAFGAILVYDIGLVHGLFTGHPQWTAQ